MSQLTQRQSEVLAAITENLAVVGPTVRELMPLIDVSCPNGVVCHLNALESKGLIERGDTKSRNIRLTDLDGLKVNSGGKTYVLVPLEEWDA